MNDSTFRRVTKLSPAAVRSYLPRLSELLGEKDQERLHRTIDLFADNCELRLSEVLDALFENRPVVDQLTAFRLLRSRVTEAAQASGVPLRLTTDTRKRSVPAKRRCYFVRVDPIAAQISADNRRFNEAPKYVPALAVRGQLDNFETHLGDDDSRKRTVAVDLLNTWLNGVGQPRYGALLGDLGIGKTTTCKYWAACLSERRAKDLRSPLPIYFDLRAIALQATARNLKSTPEAHLQTLLEANPLGLSPRDVIRYVRHEGAVVIFDGLDEVLVHLYSAQGKAFVRQLLSILPPEELRAPEHRYASRPGRVLVTCRTHYFRTLRDQDAFLFAEQYGSSHTRAFEAFLLLPFDEEQVLGYLCRTFPADQASRYLGFIGEVHNLGELAARPLLLRLISEQLPMLEEQRMRGERINGARIYANLVKVWLNRDQNKHRILPEHKQIFMEELAANLSRRGCLGWRVDLIEQWLVEFINDKPAIRAHYPEAPIELLKEDLRTATFIVREGEDQFRFAHKSLQEFFLACYLKRGLTEWDFERWKTVEWPGEETLVFLGQLLQIAPSDQAERAIAAFRHLRDTHIADANFLAFRYGLIAHEDGYPAASLAGFQLQRTDMRRLKISGKRRSLNLDRVCFAGTKLDGVIFDNVSLEDCDFSDASLTGTEFHRCRLVAATFFRALLIGTLFRHCNASDARFTGAGCYRTQWLLCHLPLVRELPLNAPTAFFAQCEPHVPIDAGRPVTPLGCDIFDGHLAEVTSAAFSPDGRYVLSGSRDASLKLWDAITGDCLRTLRGHRGAIHNVAFLPGGARFVSGAADGTLRVWEASSGLCVSKLIGHGAAVNSVTCSPDGKYVLSSSNDCTVKLWSVATSDCLLTLSEHRAATTAATFSADGTQILSGARDRSIRLFDLATGQCLKTIDTDHEVLAVAFSPQKRARRVLLGLGNGELKILDAISGQLVHELSAATGQPVLGAIFSADGETVLCGRKNGELALWNAVTCEKLFSDELVDPINGIAFSSDGQRFIAMAGNRIEIFNAAGAPVRTLCAHWSRMSTVAVTCDGTHFQCNAEDAGSLHLQLPEAHIVEPSQPGIFTARDTSTERSMLQDFLRHYPESTLPIALRDLDLGEHHYSVQCSQALDTTDRTLSAAVDRNLESLASDSHSITSMAFCSSRGHALLGQRNGSITLWDVATHERRIEFRHHATAAIVSVALSADGALALSLGRNDLLKVWDLVQGRCTQIFRTMVEDASAVRFLPCGRRVMVVGVAEVAFWALSPGPSEVLRIRSFGKGAFAWWRPDEPTSLRWTGEAWRWLSLLASTQQRPVVERYPIEAFTTATGERSPPEDSSSHSLTLASDHDSLGHNPHDWEKLEESLPP